MSRRDHISSTTKLAAALCVILDIPHEHQLLMAADQVLSLVQWDHWPIRRDDGLALGMDVAEVDRFSNLFPRSIVAHRQKTAKTDQPQMAKSRHIRAAQAEHGFMMASKTISLREAKVLFPAAAEKPKRRHRWATRKMQSRPMTARNRRSR